MKLTKLLLPIIGTTSLMGVMVPLASCSCNHGQDDPVPPEPAEEIIINTVEEYEKTYLTSGENKINFDKNTTYVVKANWNKMAETGREDKTGGWGVGSGSIGLLSTDFSYNKIEQESIKAWINDERELTVGAQSDETDLWYMEILQPIGIEAIIVPAKKLDLATDDVLKFEFKLKQGEDLICPVGKFFIGNP